MTRHFQRMMTGAERLGMPLPQSDEVHLKVARHLQDSPLPLGRLRINWVATASGAEMSIASEPITPPNPSATLALDSWTIDEHGPLVGIKSTRYQNFAEARRRALASGYDDALLANTSGQLCETSTANVFYALDGVLCTPTLAAGCLPGIARGLVIELCDVTEADAPISVLADASEVFITSSLREVQPVNRIGDRAYGTPGPITVDAADAWQRLTAITWDPPVADGPR